MELAVVIDAGEPLLRLLSYKLESDDALAFMKYRMEEIFGSGKIW